MKDRKVKTVVCDKVVCEKDNMYVRAYMYERMYVCRYVGM